MRVDIKSIFLLLGLCFLSQESDTTQEIPSVLSNYDAAKLQNLSRYFQILFTSEEENKIFYDSLKDESIETKCAICEESAKTLFYLRKNLGLNNSVISDFLSKDCQDNLNGWTSLRVCLGKIESTVNKLIYMIDNAKNLSAEKYCVLQVGPQCHNQFDYFNWTITIPEKKLSVEKKYGESKNKLRILHVTDMHLDPLYTPGAVSECGESICCQFDQKPENATQKTCGIWGDNYNADIPIETFEAFLKQAKTHKDIDIVYFTGDIVSHRTWDWDVEQSSEVEKKVMETFIKSFNVPVVFVTGNHESYPYSLFAPVDVEEDLSTNWVYDIMQNALKDELFISSNLETVKKGGFYTILVKSNLRVIVLNNNVCSFHNSWLFYEDIDPYGQLNWLVKLLSDSEKDGVFVHLLYHIPAGFSDCLGTWSREFSRIVSRFSDTITAQFMGHTHSDDFYLFYKKPSSDEVINVGFNGASLSAMSENNPSYKIYDVHEETFRVMDFEEWTFDLEDANLHPENVELSWFKLYSFLDAYGIPSMEPADMKNFVTKMATDKELLAKYNKFKYRGGSGSKKPCDDDCNKKNLCVIVTSESADNAHCESIKKTYDAPNSAKSVYKMNYSLIISIIGICMYMFL